MESRPGVSWRKALSQELPCDCHCVLSGFGIASDEMPGILVWRMQSVEPVQGVRIDLHLQDMQTPFDLIIPATAGIHWRPVVSIANQDQRIGRKTGIWFLASGIEGHRRDKRRRVIMLNGAGKNGLQHRFPPMREPDHADPITANFQIRGPMS